MRFVVILYAVLSLPNFVCAAIPQESRSAVFVRQGSTLFSDAVPVKAFEDDLRGIDQPDAGHHALTFNRLEVGFAYRGIELARFLREDYIFDFSADTMELIYRDKNKIPIPDGKVYDVYLKAQHIKAEGWRLGYKLDLLANSNVRLSLNYFEAEDLLYGALEGRVTVDDGDINGGNLAVFYHYHEDYLFNRKRFQIAEGKGYSIDLEADIEFAQSWRIQLNLYDLLGQIYWDAGPYSRADAASTQTYYDEEGYARREPTLTGIHGYKNFTQNLPVHYQVSLAKRIKGPLGLVYTREKYDRVDFDRLFLSYRVLGSLDLLTGYDFTMEAVWVAVEGEAISINVATDDWSLMDSKSLVLRLSGRWSF